jgi:hypothetical protein
MPAMKALRIHAGPGARQHLHNHGLQPHDVGVIPAAAGGPKGLVLGPLDRFIFGHWLPQSEQPVHLVGASIGAWRMATACLDGAVAAFDRLEHDYIHQDYELPPGKNRPTAAHVSERFGRNLQAFFGGRVDEVLAHPRYRLHVVTAHGRHLLAREHSMATPLGYLGAFVANAVRRKALGAWLERVVFSAPTGLAAPGMAPEPTPLPFATSDFRTQQVMLNAGNFMPAVRASCSIPFVLQAVHDIAGAPRGAYWDGGLTDYHMHLNYQPGQHVHAIDIRAVEADGNSTSGPKAFKAIHGAPAESLQSASADGGAAQTSSAGSLVLYPHFQSQLVPGWLDKGLSWRHHATPALDRMVVLSPNPDWVRRHLPRGKLPDRTDFTHFGADATARAQAWRAATLACEQLVDEWVEWLDRPDMAAVQPL